MNRTQQTTLILVEDNDDDAMLLMRSLKKAGVECPIQVITDGEAAVRYLAGEGEYQDRIQYPLPTVLLLDLKLPRKNGFEVLGWLRDQPELKRLPVIILTNSREEVDLRQAYNLGANSFLVKPSGIEETTEMMRRLGAYWLGANERPPLMPAGVL